MAEPETETWQVTLTPEAERWWMQLDRKDASRVGAVIDRLQEKGPAARRPDVATIRGSRHHNMKELRPLGGNLRILFAFDPQRRAALLLGGDKTNNWRGWYRENIPKADRLYDQHLRDSSQERTWATVSQRAGRSSAASGR